jgi:hypothetical protein
VVDPERLDKAPLVIGIVALVAAPFMLWRHEPAGWSILLLIDGVVLVAVHWVVNRDIDLHLRGRDHAAIAILGVLLLWIAVLYLTRAADDLPRLLPGHDGDSEQLRVVPGLVALTASAAVFGRAILTALPPTHET